MTSCTYGILKRSDFTRDESTKRVGPSGVSVYNGTLIIDDEKTPISVVDVQYNVALSDLRDINSAISTFFSNYKQHANIVHIYGFFLDNREKYEMVDTYYRETYIDCANILYITERLGNDTLLSECTLPNAPSVCTRLQWMKDIANGMAFMQERIDNYACELFLPELVFPMGSGKKHCKIFCGLWYEQKQSSHTHYNFNVVDMKNGPSVGTNTFTFSMMIYMMVHGKIPWYGYHVQALFQKHSNIFKYNKDWFEMCPQLTRKKQYEIWMKTQHRHRPECDADKMAEFPPEVETVLQYGWKFDLVTTTWKDIAQLLCSRK